MLSLKSAAKIGTMSKHPFSFVTALLILLLIAAGMNYIFVMHAYNSSVTALKPPETKAPPASVAAAEKQAKEKPAVIVRAIIPQWYGDVRLEQTAQGYDLVVSAFENPAKSGNPYVTAESVEADIGRQGSSDQQKLSFTKAGGDFMAHVGALPRGTWEARIRIHRGLQTLEFAEKFDLK